MNPYTVYINYFMTGEGHHLYFATVSAPNELEAIEYFRRSFDSFAENKEYWLYMKAGIEVLDGTVIPEELEGIFGEGIKGVLWLNPSFHFEMHVPSCL